MIFLPTQQLSPGMVLAKDLCLWSGANNSSLVLLKAQQPLTLAFIERLEYYNILGAYVEFENTDDIVVENTINESVKNQVLRDIKSVIDSFSEQQNTFDTLRLDQLRKIIDKLLGELTKFEAFFVNILELQSYDDYTYIHSLNVTIYSIAIALSLGFNDSQITELAISALLHDIGKTLIPKEIINKPDKLTEAEYEIVKRHSMDAAKILAKKRASYTICDAVLSHHEKYDGTGYPYGLMGNKIPINGRIIAVADVYDALTSNRTYRKPYYTNEAIEYLIGSSGSHFDPAIVKAFLTKVTPYPVGMCVTLSDGRSCVVVKTNKNFPLRPTVKILDEYGAILDLANDIRLMNVVITSIGYNDKAAGYNDNFYKTRI